MRALVPATEGQSPSLSFTGNFATLSSYFHRDSSVSGRPGKVLAQDSPGFSLCCIIFDRLLTLEYVHLGSDQTSFEEDMDTAVRDHRSYILSSCKFSDDSHIVIGDVKTRASTMQQISSNSKYRFEKTEFKDRTKVISGDMDDKAYQACVNNRSAV